MKPEKWQFAIANRLNNEVSQPEVSRIFQVGEKTFKRWLKQYREDKSLERKSRPSVSKTHSSIAPLHKQLRCYRATFPRKTEVTDDTINKRY